MDAKKIKGVRQRLSSEHENLLKSINRNRLAAEQIKVENTEDEGDLATISHDRELLYNLHESDFQRLRFIQEALKTGGHRPPPQSIRLIKPFSRSIRTH